MDERVRPVFFVLALACAAMALGGCSPGEGPGATATTGKPAGTTSPVPDLRAVAWKSAVNGAVYAQPVIVGNRVFVATEEDEVYALSLGTGHVVWHASIGRPLTDVVKYAGCGNIDPLGITSTPVADIALGTIYVVGEVSNGASPPVVHRELVGFDMTTGEVVRSANADPTGGGRQINLLQRAGLALDNGRVLVSYGGLYGDCGFYHGWVVGVSVTPGLANIQFDTTAGGSGGAVWQGGAPPSVGPHADLYVVTGNPNAQGAVGYYESVVKLSPTLVPQASFRDRAATGDEDFGTAPALLLPDGTLFAVGKTDIGYVLEQSDLRLVATIPGVCDSNPDGRLAFDAATDSVYVPCRGGGIQDVELRTSKLEWRAGSANSSPILAAGSLWALSYPDGTLEALDPVSGRVEQTAHIGRTANFATPAYADGTLVTANAEGTVEAFRR